jgi:hypothetical protein
VLDLVELARDMCAQPVHLVGMSLGGLIGAEFAFSAPELVKSLALIDVAPGVSFEATARMRDFIGRARTVASVDAAVEAAMRVSPQSDRARVTYQMQTLLSATLSSKSLRRDRRRRTQHSGGQPASRLTVEDRSVSWACAAAAQSLNAATQVNTALYHSGDFSSHRSSELERSRCDARRSRPMGRDTPFGKVRINAPSSIAPFVLGPVLGRLIDHNPKLELEIVATDRLIDIVEEGFDAGIRLGESLRTGMTAVKMNPRLRLLVVGSPAYFERHPVPKTPADLRAMA